MIEYKKDDVVVRSECELDGEEWQAYAARAKDKGYKYVYVELDGEDALLRYDNVDRFKPFERIRRITGYLVGTTERFNDAKRAEERDRVKHAV